MQLFGLKISTQTASFRHPEFQNFHKTLDLPPPTTIIGLVGAALGMSPMMAQVFFDENAFEIGVAGYSAGRMRDTWKYNRRTTKMHMYDPLLDGGVIQREHLVGNQFFLVFATEKEAAMQQLHAAFQSPYFALTMGNSDAVAKVKTIENLEIAHQSTLSNCVVKGDIVGETLRRASERFEFSIYQTAEPISIDLPTRFDYKSDYGRRSVSKTATFSFVNTPMQLNFDVKGVQVEEAFVPLFSL
jgi:CRISPR-associated protein Cas5t